MRKKERVFVKIALIFAIYRKITCKCREVCYNKRCGAKLRYAVVFVLGGQIQYGKCCEAKLRYASVFVLGGQIQYGIIGEDCEQELFPPVADRELFR